MSARREAGFTLVELIGAMAVFMIVITATLRTLDVFAAQTEQVNRRNDSQQETRAAVSQMARELRNLASPTPGRPQAVDEATAYDLVFQTVDPAGPNAGANRANVERLRYCLDDRLATNARIWRQVQTWTLATPPAPPSTGSCPDGDARWSKTTIVATNAVNTIGGQLRPVWQYNAAANADISFLRTTLIVDLEPGGVGSESTLSTGVFLRNQNRAPVAAFTATPTGSRHVLLNGSISSDPEGQPLDYAWLDGPTEVGTGATLDYVVPAAGTRWLTLEVSDPGGLVDQAPSQAVDVR